ncbi:unnamed protein product [Rhizophagus irregularis]|nr:unnamed protein product [Rhizophagus irregularis]
MAQIKNEKKNKFLIKIVLFMGFPSRTIKISPPPRHSYLIKNFNVLSPCQTTENFEIPQFELDAFVDIDDKEKKS